MLENLGKLDGWATLRPAVFSPPGEKFYKSQDVNIAFALVPAFRVERTAWNALRPDSMRVGTRANIERRESFLSSPHGSRVFGTQNDVNVLGGVDSAILGKEV